MDWTQFYLEEWFSERHKEIKPRMKHEEEETPYHKAGEQIVANAEHLSKFKAQCDNEISEFVAREDLTSMSFPPVDNVMRYIMYCF